MSYDVYLNDSNTGEVVKFNEVHNVTGGTYAMFGTDKAWLNITYNYSDQFRKVLGPKGIRIIYGMTGAESLNILTEAILKLNNDVDPDYWKSTEGNAKRALNGLLYFAACRPDEIWDGD